jgi:putative transcriptional regulator
MPSARYNNQFLIAMPAMDDPNFHRTVTLICQHDDEGAIGLIVNRPLEVPLQQVFEQMDIDEVGPRFRDAPIFVGGPVQQERGFVLHQPIGTWDSTLSVSDDLGMTTSRDILAAMASGDGPDRAMVALGYAGWGAGQLEAEMASNSWLNAPADQSIIFDLDVSKRWLEAARLLGVDIDRLSDQTGHA